jgi:hypothetical protein
MKNMYLKHGVTLQINLSPGDAQYAHLTVPHLIRSIGSIDERILVVDCIKAPRTKLFDADTVLKEPRYSSNLKIIVDLAKKYKEEGLVDEIYFLTDDKIEVMRFLSDKYLGGLYNYSHSYGGTGQMSYWWGLELAKYKYVLHFDGDIVIHTKSEPQWLINTLRCMEDSDKFVFGAPRHAPPISGDIHNVANFEGIPLVDRGAYFSQAWFSTRCFIVDREKLDKHLPLLKGKIRWELILRRLWEKDFRFDPEIVFHKRLGQELGVEKVILKNSAFFIHPHSKPKELLSIFESIIISFENRDYPTKQEGETEILIDEWQKFKKN